MSESQAELREKIASILNFQRSISRSSKSGETMGHVDADAIMPTIKDTIVEEIIAEADRALSLLRMVESKQQAPYSAVDQQAERLKELRSQLSPLARPMDKILAKEAK